MESSIIKSRKMERRKYRYEKEGNKAPAIQFNFTPKLGDSAFTFTKPAVAMEHQKPELEGATAMDVDASRVEKDPDFNTLQTSSLTSAVAAKNFVMVDKMLEAAQNMQVCPFDWKSQLNYALLLAVTGQQTSMVRKLLDAGADMHQYNKWYPLLFTALDLKKEDVSYVLLEKCTDDDSVHNLSCTTGNLLHAAVRSGCLNIVKQTCAQYKRLGIDLNTKNESEGMTALHFAIRCVPTKVTLAPQVKMFSKTHTLKVRKLRAKGLLKKKTGSEESPSNLLATSCDELNSLKKNLKPTADVYGKRNNNIMEHNLDILSFLIQEGVDLNIQDSRGRTPLHEAAIMGYTEEARLLLDSGADPLRVDNDNQIPWICAVTRNHVEVMEAIAATWDIATMSVEGTSLLNLACAAGSLECVKILIPKGASVTSIDSHGMTPLMSAVKNKKLTCAQYLLKLNDCGVNVMSGNKSALHLVLDLMQSRTCIQVRDMLTALMAAGADLDLQDSAGHTPLLTYFQSDDCRQWLLEHGANRNYVAPDSTNILYLATQQDSSYSTNNVLNLILEHNVDVMSLSDLVVSKDEEESAPLRKAVEAENTDLCKVLLNAKCSCRLMRNWLKTDSAKTMRQENADMRVIIERIEAQMAAPASLQEVARQAVLTAVGRSETKVDSLCLPNMVKHFMKWTVFMKWNELCCTMPQTSDD